jgi:hypothetical protein
MEMKIPDTLFELEIQQKTKSLLTELDAYNCKKASLSKVIFRISQLQSALAATEAFRSNDVWQ